MTLNTAIDQAVDAAEAAAQAALTATQTAMDAAVAAVDTPGGDCLEGMILLDEAWDAVTSAFEAAGRAESLRDLIQLGGLTVPGILNPLDFTTIAANVATKTTAATTHANYAQTYVLSREQLVRDAFKGCVTTGVLAPLLGMAQTCVNAGIGALNAAINNAIDPGSPPGSPPIPDTTLQGMVSALIARAAALNLDNSGDGTGCNLGVYQLKLALDLIQDAKTKIDTLSTCLGELGAIAPSDPLIPQGQAVVTAAQGQITAAQGQLDSDPSVVATWMNRAHCLLKEMNINIKVRDESGDEQGSGVNVSLGNPIIEALLPLPTIPLVVTHCPGSEVTVNSVPMAAVPLAPPAGAPPKPPGVPDLPTSATLIFNVAKGGGRTFSAAVDFNGLLGTASRGEITLQLADVSSDSSCP